MRMKPKVPLLLVMLLCLQVMTGCTLFKREAEQDVQENPAVVERYDGEMSKVIPSVYTAKKEFALVFNGMGDDVFMSQLLDALDKNKIEGTFFLPGVRVAEEPGIAREIAARGYEIQNNTLHRTDLASISYDKIYKEVHRANEVIFKETGHMPAYVATGSGEYSDDIRLVAAQSGLDAVISYSLNLKKRHMETSEMIVDYVNKYMTRGGIIALNTEEVPQLLDAIPLIADIANKVGYQIVPLSKLIADGGERKPLEEIAGYDAARINADYKNAKYTVFKQFSTNKKEIALTFDDWGTDFTVTKLLDTLKKYDVKATFFLRANGVERNPNLARAIYEDGHDVANHTYSHPVITSLSAGEIQEEVVKAHQVITEAIQAQPVMLFRPPTGAIDEETARTVAAAGYDKIAMYDVTTFDWDAANTADDIVEVIMNKTEAGSIILLHMLDGIHTLEALPIVIEKLHNKGYSFVKMSDLLDSKKIAELE
ncbi:polysaccharide deacetylase family protein [Paenibacillaceae bacterium]|nr:polysaccharide deacetylase family protein [Paenibacillaceae bacterium]